MAQASAYVRHEQPARNLIQKLTISIDKLLHSGPGSARRKWLIA